jgi:predicted metal-dependent peptidase
MLTTEERMQKLTLSLLTHQKYRSLGGVVMMGEASLFDDGPVSTAYTDGFNVRYCKGFIDGLSDPEVRFVILHETMHKALLHLTTWRWMWKEDPGRANLACDYVINLLLHKSDESEGFIRMPAQGALDEQYEGMDAGEVYRKLKQEGKGGGMLPGGFDVHGWDDAQGRSAEEQEALSKQIESALQSGTILVGSKAGGLDRAVREILTPKVDWAEALRDFVTSHCAGKDLAVWRKPNRRLLHNNIYLPSYICERTGRIGIGVDTSGSIGGGALTRFLSEVSAIATLLKPEVIDLLYWDTRVASHEKYSDGMYEMLAQSTKPKGGGGTRPSCVTQYLATSALKLDCMVMLSDGGVGSDWGGAWPCPVLWCITDKRITAGVGRTIYIGE